MFIFSRMPKILFVVLTFTLVGYMSVKSAYAEDYKANKMAIQKSLESEKVIVQGKTVDGVSLNPQPVPPKDMDVMIKKKSQIKQVLRKKAVVTTPASPEMKDAGLQKASGSVQVRIARGHYGVGVSNAEFKRLCPQVNVFAKRADGEMYKFTPRYDATKPAFGLPSRSWCETERITVPANEDIHFIATVIDDHYKVTPATEKTSVELNASKNVFVTLVPKKPKR